MIQEARLQDFEPLPRGEQQFTFSFIEEHKLVKLREDNNEVWVGSAQEIAEQNMQHLEFILDKKVHFYKISIQDFAEFISRKAGQAGGTECSPVKDDTNFLDKLANDAPIINLVNSILLEGLRLGSSDIHIEAQAESVRVRFRVDGYLRQAHILDKNMGPALASRVKIMSNLNIIERRLPQDGKMTTIVGDSRVEFRVSIMPTIEGESIVLRLFNKTDTKLRLEQLGFSSKAIESIRKCSTHPHGLILITGPTGSGKTTTITAILREINNPTQKIITIEDPVEIAIPGVCQIQTNDDIGMSFDSVLRRLLRHDPDIIMVGEIRDRVTAELAVRSALTGHQVWATLHTNDALFSVSRLLDMGLEPFLVADVIRVVLAQRLVRRLCTYCSMSTPPTAAESEFLIRHHRRLKSLARPVGCRECNAGYRGRIAVGEVFDFDEAASALISKPQARTELIAYFNEKKYSFMADAGIDLIADKISTVSELQRALYSV